MIGVGPIPVPVAEEPDVLLSIPSRGPIAVIGEDSFPATFDIAPARFQLSLSQKLSHTDKALVGPAGKRHRLSVEEQFRPIAFAGRLAEIGDSCRAKIDLHDLVARPFIEPRQHGPISHGLEVFQRGPASEENRLILAGPVDDRRFGRTGVFRRKPPRLP